MSGGHPVLILFCLFHLGIGQDIKMETIDEILQIVQNLDAKTEDIGNRLNTIEDEVLQLKNQAVLNQEDLLERHEFSKEAFDDKMTSFNNKMSSFISNMSSLDSKMTSLNNKMSSFDSNLTLIDDEMMSFDVRLIAIQDLLVKTSTIEQLDTIQHSLTEELGIQREILTKSCSRTQVETLQDLLATDECLESTHNCSEETSSCVDLPIGFKCICNQGYQQMTPFICYDMDECTQKDDSCDTNAQCTNSEGSFSCLCHLGYTGDGQSCTALPCDSPSQLIHQLGCITPVKGKALNWTSAQADCKASSSKLIEVTSQTQLNQLKEHFEEFFGQWPWPWVGIRNTWSEGGAGEAGYLLDPQSPLGSTGKVSDEGEECIVAFLKSSPPYLMDSTCHSTYPSLCQLIY